MTTLEIKIPPVAHIVVTGVPNGVKSAVMQRIQQVLAEDFGAMTTVAMPAEPATPDDVRKFLWMLSEV